MCPSRISGAIVVVLLSWQGIWAGDALAQPAATTQRTYAVADLVVPINMDYTKAQPKEPATTQNELIELIQKHIAPGTWSERGPGVMSYYAQTMSLVVTHTPAVQAEIHKLLTKMRRGMDKEVTIEMRFVSISEAAMERLIQELAQHFPKDSAAAKEALSTTPWPLSRSLQLDDKQALWFLEAMQGDRRTNIMQSPKITMFNGQKATITVGDQQPFVTSYETKRDGGQVTVVPKIAAVTLGHQHTLQPVIEADGKTVRLAVKLSISSLNGPTPLFPVAIETTDGNGKKDAAQRFVQQPNVSSMNLETTFKIPAGQTQFVFLGSMFGETRTESTSPYLSRIPYVNRLVRNPGYGRETQHTIVLITPRIVIATEETAAK